MKSTRSLNGRSFFTFWILAATIATIMVALFLQISLAQAQEDGRPVREPKNGQTVTEPEQDLAEMTAISGGIGSISGTVTDESSGLPLPDISIQVFDYPGPEEPIATGQTNSDGSYLIDGLSFGNYQVGFFDLLSGDFLTEFFDDAFFIEDAQNVIVTSGATVPDIDAEITYPGQISGRVTAADSGSSLPDILVEAYYLAGDEWQVLASAATFADGNYVIDDLVGGNYRLQYMDESGTYGTIFYGDVEEVDEAADVAVTLNNISTDVNIVMPTSGHISGIVTANNSGAPIAGVVVSVNTTSKFIGSTTTDDSGFYEFGGLSSGNYRLHFEDPSRNYLEEYYDDVEWISQAEDIPVVLGSTTTVDNSLISLGRISGTVTSEDSGEPLEGILVSKYELDDDEWDFIYPSKATDADGHYELDRVQPGTYRLRFHDQDNIYSTEVYQDVQDIDSGVDISVELDDLINGIDASLSKSGFISGQVTAEDSGLPLEGINVLSRQFDGTYWDIIDDVLTDAGGFYTVGGMTTGSYRVQFVDESDRYLGEFYDNVSDVESAVDVPVTLTETITDINASLAPSGIITGTVTSEHDGSPLHGKVVVAYQYDGSTWDYVKNDYTDAAGSYEIGGLESGTYRIKFFGTGSHLDQYYEDAATIEEAQDIVVVQGQKRIGIDAALVKKGNITGTVTSQVDGQPLENVSVYAYRFDNDWWRKEGDVDTDTNGNYDIAGLPAGTYKLSFRSSTHVEEYYNHAPDIESADAIIVNDGATTSDINMVLYTFGRISGTVTAEVNGAPLEESQVTLYAFQDENWDIEEVAYTDANGNYEFDRLYADTYRVSFVDGSSPHNFSYQLEFYGDSPDLAGAADIPLALNQSISGIDAELTMNGYIGGRIVDELSGELIANCWVYAYRFNGTTWESAGSQRVDGIYRFNNLTPGTYRIKFEYSLTQYQDEYYENAADIDNAADIAVAYNQPVLGIDAALTSQGKIIGEVTDEIKGEPLENITIYPYYEIDDYWSWSGKKVQTDANGYYEIGPLSNEFPWRLKFLSTSGKLYINEFYDDVPDVESATDISVPWGTTITGIDADLMPYGNITGTLTDINTGAPISNYYIYGYQFNGSQWEQVVSGYSQSDGSYTLQGLTTGEYRVKFRKINSNYGVEYYDNAFDINSAADISVIMGYTTPDINAALKPLGQISGSVTAGDSGAKIPGIRIIIYSYDGSDWVVNQNGTTDDNGYYELGGLEAGTYRLYFYDPNSRYIAEYYDDGSDIESADDVSVILNQTTNGIDAVLTPYGRIRGRVMAEDSQQPLEQILVSAYEPLPDDTWNFLKSTHTDGNGDYELEGFRDGVYRLMFSDSNHIYDTEYFDNAQNIESATDVSVVANTITEGIDAALGHRGHITGVVSADYSDIPVSGIEVWAKNYNGSDLQNVTSALTDENGFYDLDGLSTGIYKVYFKNIDDKGENEYFDNVLSVSEATDVPVIGGQITSGIDASINRCDYIEGRVTAEAGGGLLENIEVCAYIPLASSWEQATCVQTDVNGQYLMYPLEESAYHLRFQDPNQIYVTEFFENAPSLNDSDPISLINCHNRGIDAALAEAAGVIPANDDFDNPYQISNFPYFSSQNVEYATTAGDDPPLPCIENSQGYSSVWYAFTPEEDVSVSADSEGSDYDTVLAVWQGERGSLSNVACDSKVVNVTLEEGNTYYLEIAGANSNLGNLELSIDLFTVSHFENCAYNTGNDATVAIISDININDGLLLEVGDELAIFTPDGEICAGYQFWTGQNIAISAWGNDARTAEKDGLDPGEEMKFYWYDRSTGIEYRKIEAGYMLGDGFYNPNSWHAVTTFDVTVPNIQSILLKQGWNLISSNVDPQPAAMNDIFAPPIEDDLLLCKNGDGEIYWPSFPIDQIGDWNPAEAYQCYMNNPSTLQVRGMPIDDGRTMNLHQGWNMIAYWPEEPLDVETAVAACSHKILLAKNGDGEIYWPAYNLNQIGEMQPGQGYQLYLTEPCTFSYP